MSEPRKPWVAPRGGGYSAPNAQNQNGDPVPPKGPGAVSPSVPTTQGEREDECSYANGDWQFWDDVSPDAPVLLCDVHGLPAWWPVYACEPGQETGPCQAQEAPHDR